MNERLRVEIPFEPDEEEDVEALAAKLIKANERKFRSFFDRLINEDARYTFLEDSLSVPELVINGAKGFASIIFTSDFYAGCRDMNGVEDHEESLEFEIRDGHMIFDIELPPRWKVEL